MGIMSHDVCWDDGGFVHHQTPPPTIAEGCIHMGHTYASAGGGIWHQVMDIGGCPARAAAHGAHMICGVCGWICG